jgi:hypothetical protein
VLGELAHFLNVFDVSTAYPPLLAMLDQSANDAEMSRAAKILESYLVRRAVCGADTKAYNRMYGSDSSYPAQRRDGRRGIRTPSGVAQFDG